MANESDHHRVDISDSATRDAMLGRVLAWYRAMGVEDAVSGDPTDWLAKGSEPPRRIETAPNQQRPTPPPVSNSPSTGRAALPPSPSNPKPSVPMPAAGAALTLSDEAAEAAARTTAEQAGSLDELRRLLTAFDGCGLKTTAKTTCFYRGGADAALMIIGEAPGRDDDRAGEPFSGDVGRLLERMLAAIDLTPDDAHMTNVVYWRPPGNRRPTQQETLICRPFLERQIALVKPRIIVTVGGGAAKWMLGVTQSVLKVRGKWSTLHHTSADQHLHEIPVMPTLHPDYLLQSPAYKRQAWRDLLAIRARLDETDA